MSVWETLEALKDYVYASKHIELLKSKVNWFAKMNDPHLVLWWVRKDHLPSVDEALEKLRLIKVRGPSAEAFTFAKPYQSKQE